MNDIENILRGLKEEAVPSDTFRTNAKIRILNTVTSPHPLRMGWYRRPRVFGYTLGTALATIVLSAGTVYAAQSSLPNNPLYPVKILSERVALTLSPTESLKTTVAQTIISRRVTEVEESKKHGDERAVRDSISHFNQDVDTIQKRKDVSQEEIKREVSRHNDVINKEDETSPTPTPADHQTEIKVPEVEGASHNRED